MTETVRPSDDSLYIVLLSVHGLIRTRDVELGRDADTGGQVGYVLDLARALSDDPRVDRVDLITRLVIDGKIDSCYADPFEEIAPKAKLIRLPFGPRRYLRKETLWPYLDSLVTEALKHFRRIGRVPDFIHSHYADAGYAGARLSALLGIPLVHTGHSLGRVKRERLLAKGVPGEKIESRYHMSQRIEGEEQAVGSASLVIASTHQEVDEQYAQYENYDPRKMVVIPPGVDLSRFRPPKGRSTKPPVAAKIDRFLRQPKKPMVLAISRPDERKNISTLVTAFAESPSLKEAANLVIVAGNRDDIRKMERGPRHVLTDLLLLVDRYDLYGHVSYPKQHDPEDVPDIYRVATMTRGVFVNPALTEPFGLTLLEAAASGLPVVATHDGGPRDILAACRNGLLIDPLDSDAMGDAILDAISDRARWRRWSRAGLRGVDRHFSWKSHVDNYLKSVGRILKKRRRTVRFTTSPSRLPTAERLLVCDIDNTLIGDPEALSALLDRLGEHRGRVGLGIATGRRIESAIKVLKKWNVPVPDLLITSVGAEIFYAHKKLVEDRSWRRHIDFRWEPERLREAMSELPGLRPQPTSEQREHKISYFIEPDLAPSPRKIVRHLRGQGLQCHVIASHDAYVDLLPIRASKGLALMYVAMRWGLPPERILVAGDSGNDAEMLSGASLGVVVGNYSRELKRLEGRPRVYFADETYARGIIEGVEYYDFFGEVRIPNDDTPDQGDDLEN